MRRDELGIPILGVDDIELIAERFLAAVAPQVLETPQFTPLAEILTTLQNAGQVTVSFTEYLGVSKEGHKFLGYYAPGRRHIAVDASLLADDPRLPFTIAHELGHFYLHTGVSPAAIDPAWSATLSDTTRDLVVRRVASTSPRSLLEWQANRFAGAILIPRRTARDALVGVQRELGITRNLGQIWRGRPRAQRDFRETVRRLSAVYQVSQSATRVRLSTLGMLHEESAFAPSMEPIGDIIRRMSAG